MFESPFFLRSTSGRRSALLRIVLGVMLLLAAAFKAEALMNGTSRLGPFFASPRLQIGIIQAETLLGLWLLLGFQLTAARWTALAFFTGMAIISGYLGTIGESSCGCLGRISINPWFTFAIDGAVVAALCLWRPAKIASPIAPAWLKASFKPFAGGLAFLCIVGGTFLLACENTDRTFAWLRGDRIAVEPQMTNLGEGVAGQERGFPLQLTNRSDQSLRIIGGTSSCSCIATDDLPITLGAGESRIIRIRMTFTGSAGLFRHRFVLYTDDAGRGELVVHFAGHVIAAES